MKRDSTLQLDFGPLRSALHSSLYDSDDEDADCFDTDETLAGLYDD
jgi:hypothetical protein